MFGQKEPNSDKVALSPSDPNSFSNPEEVYAEHYHIKWWVDFSTKTISGSTTYNLVRRNPKAQFIVFDCKDVTIKSVKSSTKVTAKNSGQDLEYTLGDDVKTFGKPLRIKLPVIGKDQRCSITIEYQSSGSTCFLWLPRELTCDKTLPYMLSQGQPINFRSVMPCQDTPSTKATYTAEVTVPKEFLVLMSAAKTGVVSQGRQALYKFEQSNRIPSYLIAIAVGKLVGKKAGPRTTVYAEPSVVDAAAHEFAETERMLQIAEKLFGKYIWGEYNLLVLPPSFLFGGMENPCITFVTPALLAGDRSLTDVLVHEICHSWTGNLVTFKSYEHFWLSEGPTMYLERLVLANVHGEAFRQFQSIGGYKELKECIMEFGPTSNATRLVPDLRGVDPDDYYSIVPYEKGYYFLYYLEKMVGGSAVFLKFLKHYIEINKFKSPDSETFKKQFIEYFTKLKKGDMIKDIEWDKWFYAPGMPIHEHRYDNQLGQICLDLKTRWKNWDPAKEPSPFNSKDLDKFHIRAAQLLEFLALILDDPDPFDIEKVKAMQAAYDLNAIKNAEIRFKWLRLCIRARWTEQLPLVFAFLAQYGRGRYIFPLYSDLNGWSDARKEAVDTFLKQKSFMLASAQKKISHILNLDSVMGNIL